MDPLGVRKVRLNDWVTFSVSERMTRGVIWKSPKFLWNSLSEPPRVDTIGVSVRISKRATKGVKSEKVPLYPGPLPPRSC